MATEITDDPVHAAIPERDDAATALDRSEENSTQSLYRAALGTSQTDYYCAVFARFDVADRAGISWNWGAALLTLNWLAFRQLWGAALAYAGAVVTSVLLVFGIGKLVFQLDAATQAGLLLALLILSVLLPGMFANALLYKQCRKRMEAALASHTTLPEACAMLGKQASGRRRMIALGAGNLTLAIVAGGIGWSMPEFNTLPLNSEKMALAREQGTAALPAIGGASAQGVVSVMARPASAPASVAASAPASAPAPTTSAASAAALAQASSASAAQPPSLSASAGASGGVAMSLSPQPGQGLRGVPGKSQSTVAPAEPTPQPSVIAHGTGNATSAASTASTGSAASSAGTAKHPSVASTSMEKAPQQSNNTVKVAAGSSANAAVPAVAKAAPNEGAPAAKTTAKTTTQTTSKTAAKTEAKSPAKPRKAAASESAAPASASASQSGSYLINVGLFADDNNALNAFTKLKDAGLPALTQVLKGSKGKRTRVRVGPFETQTEADAAAEKIHTLQLDAVVFRQ